MLKFVLTVSLCVGAALLRPDAAQAQAYPNRPIKIVVLGRIAHETAVKALGGKRAAAPFTHGGRATLGKFALFSSYHCSRYNTNTGVLTPQMFRAVFAAVRKHLDESQNATL